MNLNFTQQQTMKKLNSEEKAFLDEAKTAYEEKKIPKKHYFILVAFFESFREALGGTSTQYAKNFQSFLRVYLKDLQSPYTFPLYHKKIRAPFDYYRMSVDFFRPLVDFTHSKILGADNLKQVENYQNKKENVVFFSNHQAELDPHAISMLLEKDFPQIAESIIAVAGEKVITDPIAIPFSIGYDLLCIYSKKYINNPPEHQHEKLLHNKKTMEVMQDLLKEGGKIIYVAPSGGRDRKNVEGKVVPAPFDSRSIEMFYLMAKGAKTPTHFYPLALSTYDLLPPPEATEKEVGEHRKTKICPLGLALGDEIDMKSFDQITDKSEKREKRTEFIYNQVLSHYKKISPHA